MRELVRSCVGNGAIWEGRNGRADAAYWQDEGLVTYQSVIPLLLSGHKAKRT